jgi:ectoine hydroxylase-related dioxygenase (phytanoyl-CoA dioxygenase family)
MRMTADERRQYREDGFLLRRSVFAADELTALRAAVEEVAARVAAHARRAGSGPEIRLADGHRLQFSSRAGIQWEWAESSQTIRLIEPADHLDARIAALFDDARMTEPMRDALRCDAVCAFTCKLNLKRPREGSEFPFHQDYPYWYVRVGERAADVATAFFFLDDADAGNGALRVLPGSQRGGPAPRDPKDPSRSLADPSKLDTALERVVEAPAGSLLLFGSLLVHRSSPNRSGRERRALLLSFQPAGRVRLHEAPFTPERVEELP